MWMDCGCLCDLNAEYIQGVVDWQQGLGVVQFEAKGRLFSASALPICNGQML
jgi:hypothetical protein